MPTDNRNVIRLHQMDGLLDEFEIGNEIGRGNTISIISNIDCYDVLSICWRSSTI